VAANPLADLYVGRRSYFKIENLTRYGYMDLERSRRLRKETGYGAATGRNTVRIQPLRVALASAGLCLGRTMLGSGSGPPVPGRPITGVTSTRTPLIQSVFWSAARRTDAGR